MDHALGFEVDEVGGRGGRAVGQDDDLAVHILRNLFAIRSNLDDVGGVGQQTADLDRVSGGELGGPDGVAFHAVAGHVVVVKAIPGEFHTRLADRGDGQLLHLRAFGDLLQKDVVHAEVHQRGRGVVRPQGEAVAVPGELVEHHEVGFAVVGAGVDVDGVVGLEGAVVIGIADHTHNQVHGLSIAESFRIERQLQVADGQYGRVNFRQDGQICGTGGSKIEEVGAAMPVCGEIAINVRVLGGGGQPRPTGRQGVGGTVFHVVGLEVPQHRQCGDKGAGCAEVRVGGGAVGGAVADSAHVDGVGGVVRQSRELEDRVVGGYPGHTGRVGAGRNQEELPSVLSGAGCDMYGGVVFRKGVQRDRHGREA